MKASKQVVFKLFMLAAVYSTPLLQTPAYAEESGVAWVLKANAALACEEPSEQSLAQGKSELEAAEIEVFGTDYSLDPQTVSVDCGTASTIFDSYLIKKNQVATALALGFIPDSGNVKRPYKIVGH